MQQNSGKSPGPVRQLWDRLKKEVVDSVPDDIALCEYDCRKEQCLYQEWATCERRLSKASGELMPPGPPPAPPAEERSVSPLPVSKSAAK